MAAQPPTLESLQAALDAQQAVFEMHQAMKLAAGIKNIFALVVIIPTFYLFGWWIYNAFPGALSAFAFNTLMGFAGGVIGCYISTRNPFWTMSGGLAGSIIRHENKAFDEHLK
ncbi:MAG: hypothetical protein MI864_22270 [Pseudomonadales bacterium]|nr:hypothetical protein [Pseudomonadales bacterium]